MFDLVGRDDIPCSESCKGQLQRTLFGIVSSCLSTTILCAWTAAHPNVPPRGKWKAWNRLKLMFWMIVAPELVLVWAVRQYFAAKEIRDIYNNSREGIPIWSKWTLAHGHLLGMGGITLVNTSVRIASPEHQNGQVLTLDRFKELIQVAEFQKLLRVDIPEVDIRRSKGDVLFAILQTGWFIIQCVARGRQRLALTELELVTLALTSLNVATFAIWWHKPRVQEHVRIYWAPHVESRLVPTTGGGQEEILPSHLRVFSHFGGVEPVSEQEHPRQSFGAVFTRLTREFFRKLASLLLGGLGDHALLAAVTYIITFPFLLLFTLVIISLLSLLALLSILETQLVPPESTQITAPFQNLHYRLSPAFRHFVRDWLEDTYHGDNFLSFLFGRSSLSFLFGWYFRLPSLFLLLFVTIVFTLFLPLLLLVFFIFTSAFGIVTTSVVLPGAPHVPSFYAPITKSDSWSRIGVFALFVIILGGLFGGLHCVGWNFVYPTFAERNLWRLTSLGITVIPFIVVINLLFGRLQRSLRRSRQEDEPSLLIPFLFFYALARLSLVAQAFVLLRKQPSSAFAAVDWTKYVPHLFSQ